MTVNFYATEEKILKLDLTSVRKNLLFNRQEVEFKVEQGQKVLQATNWSVVGW